ncbi:hypothetical protein [Clostridium akagii]|uniref:hypothetical protein n=1 Tax=Clostridium akagii TaxID=91623 RepID=UPI00047B5AD0|nr:hypothetical protein [Clostridium akagii]
MEFKNFSNILTLSFGVISTIVTLVGLSAIFISINMQQNIQKLRDIYWLIFNFSRTPNEFNNLGNERELYKLFFQYKHIYNNKSHSTKTILYLVLFSLNIVIAIFIAILYFIKPPVSNNSEYAVAVILVIIISIVLIFFMYIFWMLNNTEKSSELPPPKQLLSGSPKKDINTLLIAGQFMKLKIIRWDHKNTYQLMVGFPLPFTNIKITNEIYFGMDDVKLEEDYYSNILILPTASINGERNISHMYSPFEGLNDYYWYNVSTGIKIPKDRDYMRVELDLINDDNEDDISVYYEYIKIQDLYKEYKDSHDPLNTVIKFPEKVTITNTHATLRGNTTRELAIDMIYGGVEDLDI